MFQPKHSSIIGIDLNALDVKLVEISKTQDHFCIECLGRAPLPDNALDGAMVKDQDAVVHTIQSLMDRLKPTSKQAVLAVPDSAVISKIIQVSDLVHHEDLEAEVFIQAEKIIPYPINEVNFDFSVLGPSSLHQSMLDVLLLASRAEHVASRVDALTGAGLKVKAVDITSYAFIRSIQSDLDTLKHEGSVAIIYLEKNHLYFFIWNGSYIVFAREEVFGMKNNLSLELGDTLALESFKNTLLLHLKRHFQFFYTTHDARKIKHLLLVGQVFGYPNVEQHIQDQFDINTYLIDPLSTLPFGECVSDIEQAHSFLVSCGLGLRHVGVAH